MPAFVVPGKCIPGALVSTQPVLWASVPAFMMFCRGISKPPLMSKDFSRFPRSILSFPLMISSFNSLYRLVLYSGFFLFAYSAPTTEFPLSLFLDCMVG